MDKRSRRVVYLISYFLMIAIGLVLLLNLIFGNKLANFGEVLNKIIAVLSFIVVCVNASFFVKTKRNGIYLTIFVIFVLLILVCVIVPIVV